MTLLDADPPHFLAYRARGEPDPASAGSRALWPVLSVVPVLFCWLLFASAAMPREFPLIDRLVGPAGAVPLLVVTWAAATITSAAALIAYAYRTQPWYTTLCLGVHLAGLLLTVLLVGGLAVLWVAA